MRHLYLEISMAHGKTPSDRTPKPRGGQIQPHAGDSEQEREQQALGRKAGKLVGDTGENRNLTGSTTWETLPEPGDAGKADRPKRH
jgi:hypothetical protein